MNRRIRYTGNLEKKTRKLLGDQEKRRLDLNLLANPLQGSTIQGTGGARKLRFPIKKSLRA